MTFQNTCTSHPGTGNAAGYNSVVLDVQSPFSSFILAGYSGDSEWIHNLPSNLLVLEQTSSLSDTHCVPWDVEPYGPVRPP
jgi:hypothetical protein